MSSDQLMQDLEGGKETEKDLRTEAAKRAISKLRFELPHKYGIKFYKWQRWLIENKNRRCFLTAANQIGKSVSLIVKSIAFATETERWPSLWAPEHGTPNLGWYLYPSNDIANIEFETKWLPLLPRGDMRTHPKFGWHLQKDGREIRAIHFNSGYSRVFKTYAQRAQVLQANTVYDLLCDEELPYLLYEELQFRLAATRGYFTMAFTATLGQDEWRRCMERIGQSDELLPKAAKKQVSLRDCRFFEDGTPSRWSDEVIQSQIDSCTSEAEIQRRIHGRFVMTEGLVYGAFTHEKNSYYGDRPPPDWTWYGGVDIGTGRGKANNPTAIVFIAVNPEKTEGIVYYAWRGDGIETTSGDALNMFQTLKERHNIRCQFQVYDHSAVDFTLIASRRGEPFMKAKKERDAGILHLNTLLKYGMLKIKRENHETEKIIAEIGSFMVKTPAAQARDDLLDALRYVSRIIPWNFEAAKVDYKPKNLENGKKEEKPLQKCGRQERIEKYIERITGKRSQTDSREAYWSRVRKDFNI